MPSCSFPGNEKARRHTRGRARSIPRLAFRRASHGPSQRSTHHSEEYVLVETDAKPLIAGFATRAFEWRGTRLRYAVGGAGPPLVLVHGLGGAAANWRALAPSLARGRRVVVPELPGHGGSAPLAGTPELDDFAAAMLAVAEAEDALPAPWVGHSLGGLVAVRAAVLRPE